VPTAAPSIDLPLSHVREKLASTIREEADGKDPHRGDLADDLLHLMTDRSWKRNQSGHGQSRSTYGHIVYTDLPRFSSAHCRIYMHTNR
jgi:hypothetical protein